MPQNEINSLPTHLQDLVNREVERRLGQAQQDVPLSFDDLPILLQVGDAPREVPLSVRLYLRLFSNSVGSLFGWFFAGFGLVFALVAVALIGLDDVIPRNWVEAGKGTIADVEASNTTINDDRVYAYHFETTTDEGEKISGVSYEYSGKHEIGDEVFLEKAGTRYRIQGLTMTPSGSQGALIFFVAGSLFGVIGLCFPIYSWFVGGKAIHLLRDGITTSARFVGMKETGVRVNRQPVMKVNFEYQVDGERYTASAHALDTSRLTDCKYKTVLYEPMQPERSVVLDGLPDGVHVEDLTGRFWVNPMRLVLPLLVATIVCGQIVAIVVFVLRAI